MTTAPEVQPDEHGLTYPPPICDDKQPHDAHGDGENACPGIAGYQAPRPVNPHSAKVLLHQFSEFLDGAAGRGDITAEMSHSELVEAFLNARSDNARPLLAYGEGEGLLDS